ncbi:Anaerobic dimethyl sulfoxide reductase chain C, anchor subunit [hydrothermal vent metagenome]|uniref:Anaerobic dimethyl sulfoxide reductase chain C, anchor subunit n=1 Tax=hydrothermal vent metagenome TaxID=652676 RepID=A0A3B0TY14_9ZZZZ
MHPAPSVILFTSLSGLGFGLLAWLGFGLPLVFGWAAFWYFFVAYALAVGGLLASTFHLGNPQRALKAFRQWRSSWLSREGILAIVSLLLMAVYAIGLIFLNSNWQIFGVLGAIASLGTIFTTSMIYAQMKTVPRWNTGFTPVLFLLYSIAGGAILAGNSLIASALLVILILVQMVSWNLGGKRFADAGHTIETATGLGFLGKVRQLESPHSGSNYLLKEMVFVVGRKHAMKLRAISIILFGVVPLALLVLAPFWVFSVPLATISHIIGLFASRWLFFAEAEHVVGLYYDKR